MIFFVISVFHQSEFVRRCEAARFLKFRPTNIAGYINICLQCIYHHKKLSNPGGIGLLNSRRVSISPNSEELDSLACPFILLNLWLTLTNDRAEKYLSTPSELRYRIFQFSRVNRYVAQGVPEGPTVGMPT